jgi:[acyl-carrier-protein] S-malonyltransferase
MKTVWMFAGQGAQFVGMGRDLAEKYVACRDLFARADDTLGYALSEICFAGPMEKLTRSDYCQPAIFAVSAACLEALRQEGRGTDPVAAAGLSLGEWTALYAAGAIDFESGLRILEARGRFMQEACEEKDGAMASVIGLDLAVVEGLCRRAGAYVANLNSPEQTVVSGERAAVLAVQRGAEEAGAKRALPLKVAGAFHSPLMESAARRLEERLADFVPGALRFPVAANTTGQFHGGGYDIRRRMVEQVTHPVQWVECLRRLGERQPDLWIEFGPGRVLSGLLKRVDSEARVCHIQDLSTLRKALDGCTEF